MVTKAEASRKYVAKTTKASWDDGMKDGKKDWAKETGSFFGVKVGKESLKNFDAGVKGKGADYEKSTNAAAYDKLYRNAARGLKR